jgi:hypothetical protein
VRNLPQLLPREPTSDEMLCGLMAAVHRIGDGDPRAVHLVMRLKGYFGTDDFPEIDTVAAELYMDTKDLITVWGEEMLARFGSILSSATQVH